MQEQDWDLFMLQFQSTDVVQHDLWGIKKAGLNPLLAVFQEVDSLLGKLVKSAEQDGANVIILSDHGMGPLEYTFSVNTWLLAQGYLQLKRGAATRFKRLMFRAGFTQQRLYRLGRLLYPLAYRLGIANSFLDITGDRGIAWLISSLFLSSDDIDWRRTRAYSRSDIGHICLNLKGREPLGIVKEKEADSLVDELIKGLTRVVNPYTGEPLLGDIFRKQEVYHGDKLAQAPDILFLPKGLRTVGSGAWRFYSNNPFDRPFTRAHHRMEGIVTAVGPPFRSGHNLQGAALIDLAPNILYLLDCPIPRYMDGKLWEEAFIPGTLEGKSPQWADLPRDQYPEEPLTAKDEEEIKQRLRNLGYLS
jgi:predicted AlkP superfamily phosphohydrolase/phosphomutase